MEEVFQKKSWDTEYYDILSQSKFVICPSGDFIWSYRFFEAIEHNYALCVDRITIDKKMLNSELKKHIKF